jgi:RimJ/RimL family protein N-acetyltransferase
MHVADTSRSDPAGAVCQGRGAGSGPARHQRPHLRRAGAAYPRRVELRTTRLVRRAPDRDRDLTAIVLGASDEDVAHFVPTIPSPYTEGDAHAFLDVAQRGWLDGTELTFAIVDRQTETLLGLVTVRPRDGGSVGYWLAREARGRGLAAEALGAVLAWVREERGVERFVLTAHVDNVASQRVAERVGFVRTGVVRHVPPFADGRDDAFLYELRPSVR